MAPLYHADVQGHDDRVPQVPLLHVLLKYHCDTRQPRSKQVKPTRGSTLDLSKESFRWRAAKIYNELPESLRPSTSAGSFRVGLKKWIRDNIPVN